MFINEKSGSRLGGEIPALSNAQNAAERNARKQRKRTTHMNATQGTG